LKKQSIPGFGTQDGVTNFHQCTGSLNQVSGPFYNFTTPESLGVIAVFAENKPSLLGAVRTLAPIIAGGNTAILIASENLSSASNYFRRGTFYE